MLRRLYDWTMGLAAHRHATAWLAVIAFLESSVFPIPPDILIIPMVLAAPTRAWRVVAIATVASVLGGMAGYAIGLFLFETVGRTIIEFYGYLDKFARFQDWYREWGGWIVFAGGFSPIPYKVITIASGSVQLDLWTFITVSIISRGGRFLLVAVLLWKFGVPIRAFIERWLGPLTFLFVVLLVLGFVVLKYLA
ncbi:MAG: DedA family protein [Alphaproteobacteria bacterium]|nr:DedA family protein [Alphaproteobacteria bacterium]